MTRPGQGPALRVISGDAAEDLLRDAQNEASMIAAFEFAEHVAQRSQRQHDPIPPADLGGAVFFIMAAVASLVIVIAVAVQMGLGF